MGEAHLKSAIWAHGEKRALSMLRFDHVPLTIWGLAWFELGAARGQDNYLHAAVTRRGAIRFFAVCATQLQYVLYSASHVLTSTVPICGDWERVSAA